VLALLLSITLTPAVLLSGGACWLTCHVPRSTHNRLLEYGIVDYVSSQRDLDGDSRITWSAHFEHLPAGVGPAYCAITRDDGKVETATYPLLVVE
jgi:hypothetical protein